MKIWLNIVLFGVIFLAGCEEEPVIPPPDPLLDETTYLHLLVEMKLVNAMIQATDSTVVIDSVKKMVFDYYHVPEAVFLNNHAYYQSLPETHKARLDSAINLITRTLTDLDPESEANYLRR